MKNSPFSPRAVVLLIACAAGLFAASVLLSVYGGGGVSGGESGGASERFAPGAYSVSAIGHAGFYDLLRRMDYNVSRSAGNVLATVGARGVLIAAEPDSKYLEDAGARLAEARLALLVLPKWRGARHERRPAWISGAEPVTLGAARRVLTLAAGVSGSVFRGALAAEENALGIEPALPDVVQLIRSDEMRPIVGGRGGILLGEVTEPGRGGRIFVLSDPDVMSNHGIVKGDNAAFMLAVIDALMAGPETGTSIAGTPIAGIPVVFDETVHGFAARQSSPLELPFRFPFVVVTGLACAAALLCLFGAKRFGVPAEPRPALDFGKAALITNSAKMLDYAGHHAAVLERYIRMTVRSAAAELRAPRSDDAALCAWLDQLGKAKRVSASCADIMAEAGSGSDKKSLPRLFAGAKKIYEWKQEILREENKN